MSRADGHNAKVVRSEATSMSGAIMMTTLIMTAAIMKCS